MLDLSIYHRFGLQILKATCESHRKRVLHKPTVPWGSSSLSIQLHDARINSEMKKCINDGNAGQLHPSNESVNLLHRAFTSALLSCGRTLFCGFLLARLCLLINVQPQ